MATVHTSFVWKVYTVVDTFGHTMLGEACGRNLDWKTSRLRMCGRADRLVVSRADSPEGRKCTGANTSMDIVFRYEHDQ